MHRALRRAVEMAVVLGRVLFPLAADVGALGLVQFSVLIRVETLHDFLPMAARAAFPGGGRGSVVLPENRGRE